MTDEIRLIFVLLRSILFKAHIFHMILSFSLSKITSLVKRSRDRAKPVLSKSLSLFESFCLVLLIYQVEFSNLFLLRVLISLFIFEKVI